MATVFKLNFEGRNWRVIQRSAEDIWYILADVCELFGVVDSSNAARRLREDEKGTCIIRTPGGPQRMVIVSEPGFYKLVLRSRKAAAERLVDFVAHDLLPEIRRTGSYHGDALIATEIIEDLFDRLEPVQPPSTDRHDYNVMALTPPQTQTESDLFQTPQVSQPKPTQAELNAEANRRFFDVISEGPGSPRHRRAPRAEPGGPLASTWAGDVADDPPEINPHIGERNPPALWGTPLTKLRAHHIHTDNGRAFSCQCYVHEDGRLAEFRMSADPINPVDMHEIYLLMNTPQEVLFRWDWSVTPIIALELLNRERGCEKSPLTEEQAEAALTRLTSGQ